MEYPWGEAGKGLAGDKVLQRQNTTHFFFGASLREMEAATKIQALHRGSSARKRDRAYFEQRRAELRAQKEREKRKEEAKLAAMTEEERENYLQEMHLTAG